MTKLYEATCENNVVKVGDQPITKAAPKILTQGKKASEGVWMVFGNKSFYMAGNTTDIVDFLAKVSSALTIASSSLTDLAGGIGNPGLVISTAAKVAQLNAIAGELDAMKVNLK